MHGKFLKPNRKVIQIFAVLAVIFLVLILSFNLRVVPCFLRPADVPGDDAAFSLSFCPPSVEEGMVVSYFEFSYIIAALMVLGIPYLIACWAGKPAGKRV